MYNLKIIKSGNRIEIYKVNNYLIRNSVPESKDDKKENLEKKDNVNDKTSNDSGQCSKDRSRALRDARNNIIRLIRCNPDMTVFITLTFKKEHDYKNSKKCLNNSFTKLRRDYKGLKYLWVMEYGDKNGRLHFHVLCNIPININLASTREKKSLEHKQLERDFENKYWNYGFVFIRELQQEDNTNIALYVSVYITKAMKDRNLEGYRIYGYSNKTLKKPIEEKLYSKDSIDEILRSYKGYKVKYSNMYPIGYTDFRGEHVGSVSYYDLEAYL